MKPFPPALMPVYLEALRKEAVPQARFGEHLKWMRFYLDFCFKYRHPPRDPDSLEPFLLKLAAKNQPPVAQEQAARSVAFYYRAMQTAGSAPAAGGAPNPAELPWDTVFRRLKEEIRVRQYSPKTLATYRTWIEQFRKYLRSRRPDTLTADDAAAYLTHLATDQHVAASTQNQAFNALLFLYRHILKAEYDLKGKVVRARRKRYIPVVLTREEVDRVIGGLAYPFNLVVSLLYGCGLRMFEALNLRVGCLNFDDGILTVHDGKGKKDRTVPLPEKLIPELKRHMERVGALFDKDLKAGFAGVFMPGALDRKWKSASRELVWQWVFPAKTLTFVPDKGEYRRYHMHESVFQKALHAAVRQARIPKRVTAHTFRHSFASHLLLNNYDIRTIQEMLGHSDVRTTMIYTHTVKSRTHKERKSPLDFPANGSISAPPG